MRSPYLGEFLVENCWERLVDGVAAMWERHPWPADPAHCYACASVWRDAGVCSWCGVGFRRRATAGRPATRCDDCRRTRIG